MEFVHYKIVLFCCQKYIEYGDEFAQETWLVTRSTKPKWIPLKRLQARGRTTDIFDVEFVRHGSHKWVWNIQVDGFIIYSLYTLLQFSALCLGYCVIKILKLSWYIWDFVALLRKLNFVKYTWIVKKRVRPLQTYLVDDFWNIVNMDGCIVLLQLN